MPFDHFDFLAPLYDRAIRPFEGRETFIRLARPGPEDRLLDIGGGTGRAAVALRDLVGRLVLADLSPGMLAQARARGLVATCAGSERLPFADGAFDCVLMVDALHHVLDQRDTAAELWRVTRPGGRIVIQEPDVRTFAVKLVALAEKLALMRSRFLRPEKIAALFDFPNARPQVVEEGFSAWIVIEKAPL